MKEVLFTKATEEVVNLTVKAAEKLIKEVIEPLGDVGNPENRKQLKSSWPKEHLGLLNYMIEGRRS